MIQTVIKGDCAFALKIQHKTQIHKTPTYMHTHALHYTKLSTYLYDKKKKKKKKGWLKA